MRFSKRIKIAKGFSLNLSRSGIGMTIGGKGSSINFGSRGGFLNSKIPLLGISTRQKLFSNSSNSNKKYHNIHNNYNDFNYSYEVDLDEKAKPIITIFDKNKNIIESDTLLRKIKSSEEYKSRLKNLQDDLQEEILKNNLAFIEIYKQAPEIIKIKDIKNELSSLKPDIYIRNNFTKNKPTIEDVRLYLEAEAKKKIQSILFWKNAKKRREYIEENLHPTLEAALNKWQENKIKFEADENENERVKNAEFLEIFKYKKEALENFLYADKTFIENEIQYFLDEISLPVDFSIDYEYDSNSRRLKIDLDLPEIEDLPTEKVSTLASGNISIKAKTQKELKQEYATCVIGIAFYFSACFFNISQNIDEILISGYTQRLNKKTGHIEDQYVYSIVFDRNRFSKLNLKNIDPIEAIENFKHTINLVANHELKTITPMDI